MNKKTYQVQPCCHITPSIILCLPAHQRSILVGQNAGEYSYNDADIEEEENWRKQKGGGSKIDDVLAVKLNSDSVMSRHRERISLSPKSLNAS